MREFIRTCARRFELGERERFQAQLVATEAVTNAIRHGSADGSAAKPIAVTCNWDDDGFTIEVGDRGRFRHREPPKELEASGRGLALIERLTDRFDLDASEEGTTVRMLVSGAA